MQEKINYHKKMAILFFIMSFILGIFLPIYFQTFIALKAKNFLI